MISIVIDFETRSRAKLKTQGMYKYAEDPSTDVLCLALKVDDQEPILWVPKKFQSLCSLPMIEDTHLKAIINQAHEIEAHNAGFERCIWREVMHKRYGFPDLPLEKIKCSAAKAAAHALPRALGDACKALGLDQEKDTVGYKVMMKMCKPGIKGDWKENPMDFDILCRYCLQDTTAEHELSQAIPDLTFEEQELWTLDQKINDRGIKVDLKGIHTLIEKVNQAKTKLSLESMTLTGGVSASQVKEATAWINSMGVETKDLSKGTVEKLLANDTIPQEVRRFLIIRQDIGITSAAKLNAMDTMSCKDERVKGTLMFHGASTGRWSGRGIQPQNFPRDTLEGKDIESVLSLDIANIDMLYDSTIKAASKCIRGMITSAEGKDLICADFSAIEGRVLAWLASEIEIIQGYMEGKDMYKIAAAPVFGIDYDQVTKEQRQVGKVIELACGYQGFTGAFAAMASSYKLSYPKDKKIQLITSLDEDTPPTEENLLKAWAAPMIMSWRKARPRTVKYWNDIEFAAAETVRTGNVHSCGRIMFGLRNNFLYCKIPSGRMLAYYDPKIV